MTQTDIPKDILIVGAGVFGLSTALALLERPAYSQAHITILDGAKELPNPVGSSVDSSRIVRADYACKPYAALASRAQEQWRDQTPSGWGGEGRYSEVGFVLAADPEQADYVRTAFENVNELAKNDDDPLDPQKIEDLPNEESIRRASQFAGAAGELGYANWNSGWADAERCVAFAIKQLESKGQGRVTLRADTQIQKLLFEDASDSKRCTGVLATTSSKEKTIAADLTILATGAWTPSLINLQGRCIATGQALAYLDINHNEAVELRDRPVVINFSRGTFLIPPNGCELKIARHGYGYLNPMSVSLPFTEGKKEVSIPWCDTELPAEGQEALREGLATLFPPSSPNTLAQIPSRPFTKTRVCWYSDTPTGDFLICHHPKHRSLFLATGGSGHGFKFFPVIGTKIVDALEGKLDAEITEMWRWRTDEELGITVDEGGRASINGEIFNGCDDGSRAGRRGMVLMDELKTSRSEM